MTNKPNGVLYVSVTSALAKRVWQHREGVAQGFSKKYNLKTLVYAEPHDEIRQAIQRERNIKHWSRAWKVDLIEKANPSWADLYETLNL